MPYGPRRLEPEPSTSGTTADPSISAATASTSNSTYQFIELNPDGSLDLRMDVPTLLVLAPIWLDLSYCQPLFDRFAPHYQIVALENRSHGRSTRGLIVPSFDFFVSAADVTLAFQVGLKLCLLFPNQVLSLALVGAGQLFAPPDHVEIFEELDQCWFFPVDEGDYYETLMTISEIFLSDYSSREDGGSINLKDRIVNTFIRRYNLYRLSSALEVSRPNHRHPCLGAEDLSGVKQPMMLLHGGMDKCYHPDTVRSEVPAWLRSKEVDWHVIDGAPHLLALTHPELIAPEEILQRSGEDPDDFSLVTPLEMDLMRAQIVEFSQYGAEVCRLQFPGRDTADPWVVLVRPQNRGWSSQEWTISRRHALDDRIPAPRQPLNHHGISISVLADRVETPASPSLSSRIKARLSSPLPGEYSSRESPTQTP
ncbi:BQ2448_4220 [Microbotryum intermedium]|uniref:BQ2448_4220 protein n=1 Tax=Microbotryum intermedium TaxID=269621 RepID=A0A238FKZ6_9BASI|nr:BQ2448_4220 [Microbotryum intermedium]